VGSKTPAKKQAKTPHMLYNGENAKRHKIQQRRPHPRHRPGRRYRRSPDAGLHERGITATDAGKRPGLVLEPQPPGALAQGRHLGQHHHRQRGLERLRQRHHPHQGESRRPGLSHRQQDLLLPGADQKRHRTLEVNITGKAKQTASTPKLRCA